MMPAPCGRSSPSTPSSQPAKLSMLAGSFFTMSLLMTLLLLNFLISLLSTGTVRRRFCFAGILCLFRERRDFAGELQAEHDERLEPVGFDNQKVMRAEPVIEAAKSVAAHLHLDAAID